METHPNNQDQSSFQLGSNALQPQMDCLNPWTNCEQNIYLHGTYDLDLPYNSYYTQVLYNVEDSRPKCLQIVLHGIR